MAVQSGGAGIYRSLPPSGLGFSFLTRPRCPRLPWRDSPGAWALQEQLPQGSCGLSQLSLWSGAQGEAQRLWVESDSMLQPGSVSERLRRRNE